MEPITKFSEVHEQMFQRLQIVVSRVHDSQAILDHTQSMANIMKNLDGHNRWGQAIFEHKDTKITFLRDDGGKRTGWFTVKYSVNEVFQETISLFFQHFLQQANEKFPGWQGVLCSTCIEGVGIHWNECIELAKLWNDFHARTEDKILKALGDDHSQG
ncbi:MAG: hypothetical protein LBI53_03465 [Candidatus Peribacteria bacterium]|jgi:hypothetical protein|nr:hypothetical protein [Candidatus Peribacteria bacterium]